MQWIHHPQLWNVTCKKGDYNDYCEHHRIIQATEKQAVIDFIIQQAKTNTGFFPFALYDSSTRPVVRGWKIEGPDIPLIVINRVLREKIAGTESIFRKREASDEEIQGLEWSDNEIWYIEIEPLNYWDIPKVLE